MFKKIQKYLLIRQPLLWNTRFVPAVGIALLLHIIFFAIGYLTGAVNFDSNELYDYNGADEIVVFFAVLVALLFFVVWFIFYLRNNAFKSFYPRSKSSVFAEFLIILLIVFLNVTISFSYFAGSSLRSRSYFTKKEVISRCATISKASVFIIGSYANVDIGQADSTNYITYKKRKYRQNSLFNKNCEYFNFNNIKGTEDTVKGWMLANNQMAVQNLMKDYFRLVREHHLSSNITPEQWFKLTYDYPDFTRYENIGRRESTASDQNDIAEVNQTFYKYYVPQNALVLGYNKMYKAWDNPIIEEDALYILMYTALGLSLLLFSFKITNARSWLFAVVSMGILWILIGITTAIFSSELTFLVMLLLIIVTILFLYFHKLAANKGKGISAIYLNLMLWSVPGLLPILYALLMIFYDNPKTLTVNGLITRINTPQYDWLNQNSETFAVANVFIVILMMYFISLSIRKWKAIAES